MTDKRHVVTDGDATSGYHRYARVRAGKSG